MMYTYLMPHVRILIITYHRYHTIYRNTIKMADRDPFLTDVGMTHELGTVDELRFLHCLL